MVKNARNDHQEYINSGAMITKFNTNGSLLAFHCGSAKQNEHNIHILSMSKFKDIMILRGHINIIYSLDWSDEQTLVSASSDRTAIVWFLSETTYSMKVSKYCIDNSVEKKEKTLCFSYFLQILPHPSFVYKVKVLSFHNVANILYIATGGRDHLLRIWKIDRDLRDEQNSEFELCDELEGHQNYITTMTSSKKSTKLFTADWNGDIIEWVRHRNISKNTILFQLSRFVLKLF